MLRSRRLSVVRIAHHIECVSETNPEPVERRTVSATRQQEGETRSVGDVAAIFSAAAGLAQLGLQAKQVFGDKGSQQPAPPPQQSPPPPAEPQAGKPSEKM
jgi:hypothetical protein